MKRIVVLLVFMVGLAGCASKEEVMAYYEAQVIAQQAKANVEANKKPLLMIQAREGEDISFTGVKAIAVYMPTIDQGKSYAVKQFKDPAWQVGTTVLGIAAGVAGLWLNGQNMVDLVNAVGQHAGHNTTVGGDYSRDGSTNVGGDQVGRDNVGGDQTAGDKVGRDKNEDSNNTDSHDEDHSTRPAP